MPGSDKLGNRFPYVIYVKKPSEDTDRIILFPCRVSCRDISYADAPEWIAEFKVPQRRLDIENVVSVLSTVHFTIFAFWIT